MLSTYQALSQRTSQWQPSHHEYRGTRHRAYGAISLAGESGEVIDILKKYEFNGHPIDRLKLIEEAGDTMWSIACLCESHGYELAQVVEMWLGRWDLAISMPSLRLAWEVGLVARETSRHGYVTRLHVAGVFHALTACLAPHGVTIETACVHNIAKLERRYPNGYSDADSMARRDVGAT